MSVDACTWCKLTSWAEEVLRSRATTALMSKLIWGSTYDSPSISLSYPSVPSYDLSMLRCSNSTPSKTRILTGFKSKFFLIISFLSSGSLSTTDFGGPYTFIYKCTPQVVQKGWPMNLRPNWYSVTFSVPTSLTWAVLAWTPAHAFCDVVRSVYILPKLWKIAFPLTLVQILQLSSLSFKSSNGAEIFTFTWPRWQAPQAVDLDWLELVDRWWVFALDLSSRQLKIW